MEKFWINEESPDDKKKQNRSIKDYFRDKLHISLHDGATVHHLVSYKTLKGVPNKVRIKDVLVLDGGNFDINDCIHRLLHYMTKKGKTFTFKDMIDELESVTIYVSEKDGEAFPISLKDYIAGDNRRIAPLEPQKVEDVPAPTGESENKEKTESMNEDTIKQGTKINEALNPNEIKNKYPEIAEVVTNASWEDTCWEPRNDYDLKYMIRPYEVGTRWEIWGYSKYDNNHYAPSYRENAATFSELMTKLRSNSWWKRMGNSFIKLYMYGDSLKENVCEDTIKQGNAWVNKGMEINILDEDTGMKIEESKLTEAPDEWGIETPDEVRARHKQSADDEIRKNYEYKQKSQKLYSEIEKLLPRIKNLIDKAKETENDKVSANIDDIDNKAVIGKSYGIDTRDGKIESGTPYLLYSEDMSGPHSIEFKVYVTESGKVYVEWYSGEWASSSMRDPAYARSLALHSFVDNFSKIEYELNRKLDPEFEKSEKKKELLNKVQRNLERLFKEYQYTGYIKEAKGLIDEYFKAVYNFSLDDLMNKNYDNIFNVDFESLQREVQSFIYTLDDRDTAGWSLIQDLKDDIASFEHRHKSKTESLTEVPFGLKESAEEQAKKKVRSLAIEANEKFGDDIFLIRRYIYANTLYNVYDIKRWYNSFSDELNLTPWGSGIDLFRPWELDESLNESAYEDFMNEIRSTDEYHKISKILERAYKALSNEEYKKVYAEAQKVKKEVMASHEGLKESSDYGVCKKCGKKLIPGENYYTMSTEKVCTDCGNKPDYNRLKPARKTASGDYEDKILARQELGESRQNNEFYRGEVIWNYGDEDTFEVGFEGKPREFPSKEDAKKAIDEYRKDPHYLSKYERDYYSGPEEGGYTSTGLILIDSKRYPDYDSAVRALEVKQADYTEDELEYVGNDIFEDSYGYVYNVEHDKGSEHSPAKSWAEAELGEDFVARQADEVLEGAVGNLSNKEVDKLLGTLRKAKKLLGVNRIEDIYYVQSEDDPEDWQRELEFTKENINSKVDFFDSKKYNISVVREQLDNGSVALYFADEDSVNRYHDITGNYYDDNFDYSV